jgi:hypothetical protein
LFNGKGFLASIVFHILLLLLLSTQFKTDHQTTKITAPTNKPIKSFLYTPPKITTIAVSKNLPEKKIVNQTSKKVTMKAEAQTSPSPSSPPAAKKNKIRQPTSIKAENKTFKTLPNKLITKESLRAKINVLRRDISNPRTYNQNVTSVVSVFNPNLTPVPKSITRSEAQKEAAKKLTVTNYGGGIAIKKNKDGNCSITQDLSLVGMDGLSATQHFKCGKSEYDKNFTSHMKKAIKKYK